MRPLQAHCHRGLGTLYATTGQREQARAELSTAIEHVPGYGDDLLAARRRRRRWRRWRGGDGLSTAARRSVLALLRSDAESPIGP